MIVKFDRVSQEALIGLLQFVNSSDNILRLSEVFLGDPSFKIKGILDAPFCRGGSPGLTDSIPIITVKALKVRDTEPVSYQITLAMLDQVWLHNGGYSGCGPDDLKQVAFRTPVRFLSSVYCTVKFA